MSKIERSSFLGSTFVLTASSATSPKIPYANASGGVFIVNSLTGGASSVSWFVAVGSESTPVPMNDGSADVSTSIVSGKAYPIPDSLFGCQYIVGAVNAGTATIQIIVKS
jgi:hypothetical protein